MYYGSETVDRSVSGQLLDAAAYKPGRRWVCTHQIAALFAWNDVMAAINHENVAKSIDVYLLEEHSCQISSRSDLKRRSLMGFLTRSPQQEQQQEQDE